jgi:hypothetical protein
MTGSSPRIWRTLVPAMALVVAACGGATTPTPGASAAAPTTSQSPVVVQPSQVADDAPAPPSGSFDPGDITLDITADRVVTAAATENAGRASGRAKADLAGYLGPDAPTVAAALDQQSSDELWKLVDDAAAARTAPTAPNVILASVRLPRTDAHSAAIPPPGMSYLGPWVSAMMLVDLSLGKDRAYTEKHHDESPVELGPNKGIVTTTSTVSVTPSGSRLVVEVDVKQTGEVNDANGHLVFRIDGTGHAHIDVQACPDAQGLATAHLEFSSDEEYFVAGEGGRVGNSWKEDDKADAQIFADEDANLDHEVFNLKADRAVKGGVKAAGAGQSTLTAYSVEASEPAVTISQEGGLSSTGGTFNARNVTKADVDDAFNAAETLVGMAVYISAKAAEKFWRSGKCIEVVVDPNGGDVGANSATDVTAKVRHKFENVDLDKTVVATMTGVKSIEPNAQKVKAPAKFTYTAGPKPKDAGIVTFKSVSNRGIGETTVTFKVGGGWKTEGNDQAGESFKGQKCGDLDGPWQIDGLISGDGLKTTSRWIATLDGTTLAGTYTFKSVGIVNTGYGDLTTTETGTGKASMVAQADGSYLMTIAGTNVTSTVVGAGSTETVTLPIQALQFTWTPGGTCPG